MVIGVVFGASSSASIGATESVAADMVVAVVEASGWSGGGQDCGFCGD